LKYLQIALVYRFNLTSLFVERELIEKAFNNKLFQPATTLTLFSLPSKRVDYAMSFAGDKKTRKRENPQSNPLKNVFHLPHLSFLDRQLLSPLPQLPYQQIPACTRIIKLPII
jgi:hypothetical protein